MKRRFEQTETGFVLGKTIVLTVVLGTLSGFTVLSHVISQASASRIDCVDNQRATYMALLQYQSDHEGLGPRNLDLLQSESRDTPFVPGRCPVRDSLHYYIDPVSGRVMCPDPAHRQ